MPRPTDLTPELQEEICEKIRNGNYFSVAAVSSGVPEITARHWLLRGEGKLADRQPTELYVNFVNAVRAAEAQSEIEAVNRLKEAAKGIKVERKKLKQGIQGDQDIDIEETTEEFVRYPEFDKWFLERKHSARWGNKRLNDLELIEMLIDSGIAPPELAQTTHDKLKELREAMQELCRNIIGI